MDLFKQEEKREGAPLRPLADRMRPSDLSEFVGQRHLVGHGKVLRNIIDGKSQVPSMILWGPPGTGKTTIAKIVASSANAEFFHISGVNAGLADVRKIIEKARLNIKGLGRRTILFIDEIHRFNKAQQDALLPHVEDGTVVLIGATTENPSFEVIGPLLSRSRVYRLLPLEDKEIEEVIHRALTSDRILSGLNIKITTEVMKLIVKFSGGDARIALNTIELCSQLTKPRGGLRTITTEIVKEALQKRAIMYDKKGDYHYDTISAFIKSMRGSDPDGAVYWLARMIEAGEDPLFIARRMVILASEDIGNADPNALVVANSAFQAVHAVGMPEARIILAQAATYLASAPKSNASYMAIEKAIEDARKSSNEQVPLHLRNAPTNLMREMGYGKGYKYAHDYDGGFVEQDFLPSKLKGRIYYRPKKIGYEVTIKQRLEEWWKKRRNKDKGSE